MPEYRRRFRRKMDNLHDEIEQAGNLTKESYELSISLFNDYKKENYEKVIENTTQITKTCDQVEKDCIKLLATQQPVASDLRFIEACIKVSSHLKRMGKLSRNIAEITDEIKVTAIPSQPLEIMNKMAKEVNSMLKRSIRSFLELNIDEASELEEDDDCVDELFDEFIIVVTESMKKNKDNIELLVHFLLIGRYLERLADRSENIGGRTILTAGHLKN
ncbi:MAG: phosphate signaling complex protein PhoU [Methanobacteriaceae archaeon]|nr:phosphate signaling complex protein PhoU [Methanobacteriaceae archaeon]